MSDLAVIGLGPMGLPIARRLGVAGVETVVWNRTPGRAPALESLRSVTTPADAAVGAVLTVLPDLPQVEEVLQGPDGLIAGWTRSDVSEPVLVIHGTVSPTAVVPFARRLHDDHGVRVIDAPMSGGTIGADAGTLTLMLGGDAETIASLMPVFEVYATSIARLGDVGAGSLGKACNQMIVASTVAAISEAIAVARRSDLDIDVLLTLLGGGLASSEILRQKGSRWRDEDFTGGGSGRNQLKDLGFALAVADDMGLKLTMTSAARDLFHLMVHHGDGDLDHTGVYRSVNRLLT